VNALKLYFMAQEGSSAIGITEYLDFFAGGAFKNFSIFMLGVMPYITAEIILQLLVLVFPKLKKISEEDGGRKKIQRYSRYGTVVVCLIQAYVVTVYADSIPDAITMARLPYTIIGMLTVTTGSMFLVWIGDQITQKGIGNGISLLIFAGIVARGHCHHRIYHVCRCRGSGCLRAAGAEKDTGSLCEAGCWKEDVRGTEYIHPLQDQSVWSYPCHFCVVYTVFSPPDSAESGWRCKVAC
jgi:hypothetical protein